ncbi:S-adenosyl-L-methionine-dependent methyltransferase [Zopfia rhizophila CBS 207.26]|uniref:S-adenosyl-L-methionine-dependent methyltransferase n=1 Tax=Zopfia rhizophila CBS 207.26 TaxID=1314779 RepID=A0A6A6EAG0_9PEZI|nr:S-adenosyl-L-methionine-dependent methyltransferase [Zopfia rhizophila CBS 207.26]
MSSSTSSEPAKKVDWSATQYLKFGNERTRAVYDLLSQVIPHIESPNPRVMDLGCGPGNSTKVLLEAFPNAQIIGMDSSPDMLQRARATIPGIEFVQGDLYTFSPDPGADLLFSNAVYHWLRRDTRVPTIIRLLESQRSGGVFAFQVPDNYHQPSHFLMRETASLSGTPWSSSFSNTRIGDLEDKERPDLDPIEKPEEWYNALLPYCSSVNIWRTEYQHVLDSANGIVEWVRGTGLQPFINLLPDDKIRDAFVAEYEKRLSDVYKPLANGKVMLAYPRLFVVAVRK